MTKRPYLPFLALAFLLACVAAVSVLSRARSEDGAAPTGAAEQIYNVEGQTYELIAGKVYKKEEPGGKRVYVDTLFEPGYREKNYRFVDGVAYRVGENGKTYKTLRSFSENFEDAQRLADFVGEKRGWTGVTLQSPQAPEVADYVALRHRILKSGADFLDNRVEPSGQRVHGGKQALKTVAVARSAKMVCAKASLDTELLHFVKGDDYYFRARYFIEGTTRPFTIMDLESSWLKGYPGLRIRITPEGHLDVELKSLGKYVFRQEKGKEVVFPTDRWVCVEAHFKLTDKQDGLVEVWQDGKQLVSQRGQTLPLADAIYNNLEVGISAHNDTEHTATVYVDDLEVSDKPLPPVKEKR